MVYQCWWAGERIQLNFTKLTLLTLGVTQSVLNCSPLRCSNDHVLLALLHGYSVAIYGRKLQSYPKTICGAW